jgi:hypothetical protein
VYEQPKSDKSAVEKIIQREDPQFEHIYGQMDFASAGYITKPPPGTTTKSGHTISQRTGFYGNFQTGSRFNWFEGGTNLTHTDGPTVNNYVGSRAIWQSGDTSYQSLKLKKYVSRTATDTYASHIAADKEIHLETKSNKGVLRTYREAVAIHNVNIAQAHSSTVDVVPVKLDIAVNGIAGAFQVSAFKTEVKTGLYACDMKIWPKMDEFRIGLLGYTLWDIGRLSVKNSITMCAINNYMGAFCSFANSKIDLNRKSAAFNGTDIVKSYASLRSKASQTSVITNSITFALLNSNNLLMRDDRHDLMIQTAVLEDKKIGIQCEKTLESITKEQAGIQNKAFQLRI